MRDRIACVHLPAFPLQVRAREAPHLAGRPAAITDASPRPAILACSRAARSAGVRAGMTPPQARALAPDVEILPADSEAETQASQGLAEALLSLSTTVDLGAARAGGAAHRSLYLRVPRDGRRRHRRGARFGEEILGHTDRLGYRARVGIADDRFTAWAAAVCAAGGERGPPCAVVPRGGASAFLAPLSIDLLPADRDVRSMLRALGIETLGDFAALPPPTVGRRFCGAGLDLQALARGEGPTLLTPFSPREPIAESVSVEDEITSIEPLLFALRPLADRIEARLRGRGAAAARLALALGGPEPDQRTEIELSPTRPLASGRALAELARAHLAERALDHPILSLDARVAEEVELENETLDLFASRGGSDDVGAAADAAVARLRAALGEDTARAAEIADAHRPERAFRYVPFSPPRRGSTPPNRAARAGGGHADASDSAPAGEGHADASDSAPAGEGRADASPASAALPAALAESAGALRLFDPPAPQPAPAKDAALPAALEIEGHRRRVVAARGPARLSGEWWSEAPLDRDYYDVKTEDGGRYWVFRDRRRGRFYLHGIFD